MTDSILNSTKKILGITAEDTNFDLDVLIHINSVFTTLEQLGIGPVGGYSITDANDTWDAFLGYDLRLNSVKTYVYLRVRMLFDPPTTSFLMNAIQEQIRELEWRLNVQAERNAPTTVTSSDGTIWELSATESFPVDAQEGDLGFDPATGDLWRMS